jgi:hypothetical protein
MKKRRECSCNIRHRGMPGTLRRTEYVFHRSCIQDLRPIANGPAPIPIPRDDAAIHLERRPPLFSDEPPSCQGPRRSRRLSIANTHVSRHILIRGQPFAVPPEQRAAFAIRSLRGRLPDLPGCGRLLAGLWSWLSSQSAQFHTRPREAVPLQ